MQLIKALYESMMKALIRFWDNQFIRNTDIDYFKMMLELQRTDYKDLVKAMTEPKVVNTQPLPDEEEWKPVQGYVPWHIRRRELENQSRMRAVSLANEAKMNIERSKTTAELEDELLSGTD